MHISRLASQLAGWLADSRTPPLLCCWPRLWQVYGDGGDGEGMAQLLEWMVAASKQAAAAAATAATAAPSSRSSC